MDGLAEEVGDATEKGSTMAAGVGDEREEGLGLLLLVDGGDGMR